jgi:hypothetical protein
MWNPVKRTVHLLLISAFIAGCHAHMPDSYGIYADTNHGQISLPGQPILGAGSFISAYFGLRGPSGPESQDLQDFIVYKKDVDPGTLGLSKLDFLREGAVSDFLGSQQKIQVNLWVPEDRAIDVDVKPVEEHRDMYIVKPRKPLDRGFYVLHIGPFRGDISTEVRVYDIVVGNANDFPSYEARVKRDESDFRANADSLLAKMNQLLNRGDYQHIQDVYRPGGNILSGSDLQSFAAGSQTWLNDAGKIVKSEVTSVKLLGENDARCSVVTTYEKAGVQQESMTIRRIGDQFFISEMK